MKVKKIFQRQSQMVDSWKIQKNNWLWFRWLQKEIHKTFHVQSFNPSKLGDNHIHTSPTQKIETPSRKHTANQTQVVWYIRCTSQDSSGMSSWWRLHPVDGRVVTVPTQLIHLTVPSLCPTLATRIHGTPKPRCRRLTPSQWYGPFIKGKSQWFLFFVRCKITSKRVSKNKSENFPPTPKQGKKAWNHIKIVGNRFSLDFLGFSWEMFLHPWIFTKQLKKVTGRF